MNSKDSATVDKRSLVVVGELPPDFLRIVPSKIPHEFDPALWLNHEGSLFSLQNSIRLSITLSQAQLTKNYGLTRMDPYCRIKIGQTLFETQTAVNGARNPVWNKVILTAIPPEIDHISIDIFDERAFTDDSHFAWARVLIPEKVFEGEQVNLWFPLSGKQGEHKEGAIHLVFTLLSDPAVALALRSSRKAVEKPISEADSRKEVEAPPAPVAGDFGPPAPDPGEQKQKVSSLKDMFPEVEEVVIISVLEANGSNMDRSINSLLDMQST